MLQCKVEHITGKCVHLTTLHQCSWVQLSSCLTVTFRSVDIKELQIHSTDSTYIISTGVRGRGDTYITLRDTVTSLYSTALQHCSGALYSAALYSATLYSGALYSVAHSTSCLH